MYTLYYSPGACSMAAHVLLNELNQPVKLQKVDLQKPETKPAEFLAVNPNGQVPVLIDGETGVREGAAIMMYLAEKHASSLLPSSGEARWKVLQWLMYCNASLHPAYSRVFFLKRHAKGEALEQLSEVADATINKMWGEIETHLSNQKSTYLCGEECSVADILMTVIANWSGNMLHPVQIGERTKKLLSLVSSRPAYKKALEEEQVQYKMAA